VDSKAGADGNIDEIEAMLVRLADTFDFTLPGEDGSFGEDLMDEFSTSVMDRTVGLGVTPEGKTLAANRGEYGEEKRDAGLPVGIGLDEDRSDQMLSLVNLKGERSVTPDMATMIFGVTPFARDKGNWFTYGTDGSSVSGEHSGAKDQPPRPFWGFDDEMTGRLVDMCEERLRRAIADIGGTAG
jgi:hypothetical protein